MRDADRARSSCSARKKSACDAAAERELADEGADDGGDTGPEGEIGATMADPETAEGTDGCSGGCWLLCNLTVTSDAHLCSSATTSTACADCGDSCSSGRPEPEPEPEAALVPQELGAETGELRVWAGEEAGEHTSIEITLAPVVGARADSSDAAAASCAGEGIGLRSACLLELRSGVQSNTGVGRIVRRGGLFGLRFVGEEGGLPWRSCCCCCGCSSDCCCCWSC